jgi:DUF4097 and DUF4098 domain-containing protein YvlB
MFQRFLPVKRIHRVMLLCAFLIPLASASDWKYEETRHDAREFVSGGYVHVRATVGDVHIKRGDSNMIRLEYRVKSRSESNVKDTRADFDVHGNNATIEFHSPSGGNTNIDVELEVPLNTNIDVHEKVGDVRIDKIDGDKDVEVGVGDIRMATEQSAYKLVRADTGIGDVHSSGYGRTSGWLGKTLKYRGEGKYELRAHVGVGDIHLDGE